MHRIIDVNVNRATEALRVVEEVSRFVLEDEGITTELKNLRHEIITAFGSQYSQLIENRDTEGDVGTEIPNPSSRKSLIDIHKANFKRLQQALRVLSEFNPGLSDKIRYDSYILEKKMYKELTNKHKKYLLNDKKLYLVTDRSNFNNEDDFLNAVASALKGGVQIVQLREKTATAKEFIALGKKVRELCSLYDAIFIINDRVDIAMAVQADGVHLGQDDMDVAIARNILGSEAIIGLSTHCLEHALQAVQAGADYIGVGPVFTTPTKPGRQAVGLEYVRWAADNVNIPWFAIGGINPDNLNEVVQAGAFRVAAVRAIINAEQPEQAARRFLNISQGG
ncbi:MAG: thiamine-phosphate diphosphorylase [Candidatus Melainabacteria bacterium GWF2_37_15]|nr:MAG: thiamine-phosphate diphosphorylase [Candidatus Melainabacteria bacterium GWF2_37_15]